MDNKTNITNDKMEELTRAHNDLCQYLQTAFSSNPFADFEQFQVDNDFDNEESFDDDDFSDDENSEKDMLL